MIRLWNRLVLLHSSKFVQKTMTIGWQSILLENLRLRKVLQGKSTLTFGWLIYDLWMIYPWVDKHCNGKDIIYRWFPPTRTSNGGFPALSPARPLSPRASSGAHRPRSRPLRRPPRPRWEEASRSWRKSQWRNALAGWCRGRWRH